MSLSSLIVQREIATIRQVEEALARQVLYGGDLVTNLLEVAKLDEGTLTLLLAESFGIQAATLGPLPFPNDRAKDLVPSELATRWSMVPVNLEGGALVVAVAEPLSPEAVSEITFALGLKLVQRVAPLVRIREALTRIYAAPLERRLQRLLARLGGQEIPGLVPSQSQMREVQMPPKQERSRVNTLPFQPRPDDLKPPSVHAPRSTQMGFPAISLPPPPVIFAPEPDTQVDERPTPVVNPLGHDTYESPRASLIQREAAAPPRPPRRRRGPITSDAAKKELEEAKDRDAILDLFFDYARQYFDYSAFFVVHGDIAEGRDAYGDGASRERVTGIGVPLDLDSVLAQAREQSAPLKLAPSKDGLDPVLLADLQRKTTGEVLVVPIIVRKRTVALFYGDSGDGGVDAGSIREVVPFSLTVGQAFEKIIVRKKLQGFIATSGGSAGTPGPPSVKVDPQLVPPKPQPSPVPIAEPPPSSPYMMPRRLLPDQPPPPENAVRMRRPSGPPIPREDPPDFSDYAGSVQYTPTTVEARVDAQMGSFEEPLEDPLEDERVAEPPPPPDPDLPNEAEREERERDASAEEDEEEGEGEAEEDEEPSPPLSGAVAVSARVPPPSSHLAVAPDLPSVIVDVDSEFGTLVDRILSEGGDDQAEAELLRQGHAAMPAIMLRFPGPVTVERMRVEDGLMRVADCGPLLRLIAGERRAALPFVLPLVSEKDNERRYWATFLLTELAYPDAVDALVPRLFDAEPPVRKVARLAARAVGEVAPDQLVDRLTKYLADRTAPSSRRVEMVEALGELRERLAVPVLVDTLTDADEDVAQAARRALVIVTRQDFARDTKKWNAWWQTNAARHRLEWLIDALMHDAPATRRAAGEELKSITKEYFGYYDDLPKRERERAQQRYRDWWNTEGRLRFQRR